MMSCSKYAFLHRWIGPTNFVEMTWTWGRKTWLVGTCVFFNHRDKASIEKCTKAVGKNKKRDWGSKKSFLIIFVMLCLERGLFWQQNSHISNFFCPDSISSSFPESLKSEPRLGHMWAGEANPQEWACHNDRSPCLEGWKKNLRYKSLFHPSLIFNLPTWMTWSFSKISSSWPSLATSSSPFAGTSGSSRLIVSFSSGISPESSGKTDRATKYVFVGTVSLKENSYGTNGNTCLDHDSH